MGARRRRIARARVRICGRPGTAFGPTRRPRSSSRTATSITSVGAGTGPRPWDVPVYAHELETPYSRDDRRIRPPDPAVGGGAMAAMSLLPRRPIDLGARCGAARGRRDSRHRRVAMDSHARTQRPDVVLRDYDRALVAGDAFMTTKQESLSAVLRSVPRCTGHRCTTRWTRRPSRRSAARGVEPSVAVRERRAMRGRRLERGLAELAAPSAGERYHRGAATCVSLRERIGPAC